MPDVDIQSTWIQVDACNVRLTDRRYAQNCNFVDYGRISAFYFP